MSDVVIGASQGKVWGETQCVFAQNNVEVHRINIKKGGYCSKHLHHHKFNEFMVISGRLKVDIWMPYGLIDTTTITDNQFCVVAPGLYHLFEALEDTIALEIYWVELAEDISRETIGGVKDIINHGT